jgi:cob(I)alamin adenosyltransferase
VSLATIPRVARERPPVRTLVTGFWGSLGVPHRAPRKWLDGERGSLDTRSWQRPSKRSAFLKIYTKKGDGGETSLFGGGRVRKCEPRVGAYGDLDELNAALGLAASLLLEGQNPLRQELLGIQRTLFGLAGEVATAKPEAVPKLRNRIDDESTLALERSIDRMESELPPLDRFILPGGAPASAALHLSRTICRRAERSLVALHAGEPLRAEVLRFVNRLSDWLFVASRWINAKEGGEEIRW